MNSARRQRFGEPKKEEENVNDDSIVYRDDVMSAAAAIS